MRAALLLGMMLFAGFIGFIFRGQFLFSAMIGKLNEKLPADRKYNLIDFWTPAKRLRFWGDWHQHFPKDSLASNYRISEMFAVAFLLGIAVLIFYLAGALRSAG